MKKSGFFVIAFFIMFTFFMGWYFIICSSSMTIPSDVSLIVICVALAVECVAGACIATFKPKGITDDQKKGIEFGAKVVAKAIGIDVSNINTSTEEEDEDADSEGEVG